MRIFADQEIGLADPARFTTPGEYSMASAVEVLKRLELEDDCEITDTTWKTPGYGNLVIAPGIVVRLGTIRFKVACDYDTISVSRISGSKTRFYELLQTIRQMDF